MCGMAQVHVGSEVELIALEIGVEILLSCDKGVIEVVEHELEQLRDSFKNLDKRLGNFSRTSARIGDRLQVSTGYKLILYAPPISGCDVTI